MNSHENYQRQHARFLKLQQEFIERVAQYHVWEHGYRQHLQQHIQRRRHISDLASAPFLITAPSVVDEIMVNAEEISAISDVTDQQWAAIAPLFNRPTKRGRSTANPRSILNGILYHLHTECAWREIPAHYGNYVTCWRWLLRWENTGTLRRVQHILQREGYSVPRIVEPGMSHHPSLPIVK